MRDEIERAAEVLTSGSPFTVLTGAGISVESGLPPFRGPGGIWEKYEPEVYGHRDTFISDPEKAWVLFNEMINTTIKAEPNEAHLILAKLQNKGIAGPIITQNIDGLHRKAGTKDVIDVHGDISRLYCPSCAERSKLDPDEIPLQHLCTSCGAYIRPDIVLYGEVLPEDKITRAWELSMSGAPMLIIGTTGIVMPVARLPLNARMNGSPIVLMDPYPNGITGSMADVLIREKAASGMSHLEEEIFKRI